ncbi:MAG: low molecular weight protein-tyrosine-phosphatase [Saprospiraceae bacterium]
MKILMVCLGNICRSPLAQGILESKIKKYNLNWEVDSAGTSGWHNGEKPDARARAIAKKRGISIENQISRKLEPKDFIHFDLICAMDAQNFNEIKRMAPDTRQGPKIELLMNFAYPFQNQQVPDPYYDGKFEEVYDLLDTVLEKFVLSTHSELSASS